MNAAEILREAAYEEGHKAGKLEVSEQIFEELDRVLRSSKTTHVGQQFYGLILEDYIEGMKKKYGVK